MSDKENVCFIGLGANLDDPLTQVKTAIKEIKLLESIKVISVSSLYRTKPVGFLDQPNFINAVMKATTNLSPLELLQALQQVEREHFRIRSVNRNMPRTLDLDILVYDNQTMQSEELILPHPSAYERSFVLIPWRELEPESLERYISRLDETKQKIVREKLEDLGSVKKLTTGVKSISE